MFVQRKPRPHIPKFVRDQIEAKRKFKKENPNFLQTLRDAAQSRSVLHPASVQESELIRIDTDQSPLTEKQQRSEPEFDSLERKIQK